MSRSALDRLGTKNFWKLVLAIHKTKVFSAAAHQVGISVSAASKLISGFEDCSGLSLLDRSVRPAKATRTLESLLPIARKVLASMEEADRAVSELQQEAASGLVQGRQIRIALPINVRNDRALAGLLDYAQKRPGIRLAFFGDECYRRLIRDEVEIAQFGFYPENTDVHAQYIRTNGFFILAAQKFIDEFGVPKRVEELVNFPVVIRNPNNRSFSRRLERADETYFLPESSNIVYADPVTCISLLRAGRAISLDVSLGAVLEELRSGKIVPILRGWHRKPNDTYVCCKSKNADDPVIRDLMGIIQKAIRGEQSDNWERWAEIFGIPLQLLKKSI